MRNVNSDAAAADTPGSPGFRPVQPQSIFQRVVKPALHSGVAIICAASIAVNTVVVEAYAQQSPSPSSPNTTRESQREGGFDSPLMQSFCLTQPTATSPATEICPVNAGYSFPPPPTSPTINYVDNGASTSHAPASGSGTGGWEPQFTPVVASIAAVQEAVYGMMVDAATQAPEVSEDDKPWHNPSEADLLDLWNTWGLSILPIGLSIGTFAWTTISTSTDNGNLADVQKKNKQQIIGSGTAGIVAFGMNYFRIFVYLLTYKAFRLKLIKNTKLGSKERQDAENNARRAAMVAATLWSGVVAIIGVVIAQEFEKKIRVGEFPLFNKRRKLLADPLPRSGKVGTIIRKYLRHFSNVTILPGTGSVVLPKFDLLGTPEMIVKTNKELDFTADSAHVE